MKADEIEKEIVRHKKVLSELQGQMRRMKLEAEFAMEAMVEQRVKIEKRFQKIRRAEAAKRAAEQAE